MIHLSKRFLLFMCVSEKLEFSNFFFFILPYVFEILFWPVVTVNILCHLVGVGGRGVVKMTMVDDLGWGPKKAIL